MAGSNPKITAEVTAVDHATQTLQNVAELSKRITKESNAALAAAAASSHGNISDTAEAASARMTALLGHLKSVAANTASAVATSFGAMSLKIVKSSMDVGAEIEKQLTKMKAFTAATPENIEAIRKAADSEGAKLPGGPTANISAARAAAMSGVPVASAEIAAQHGQMFAYETGQDAATGTEDLISHASMLQHIKDERGKPISISLATPPQIEKGLTETQNLLIAINKLAPGNMHDVYESFKFAGPSAIGAHVKSGEVAAEYIQLAEHGIRGSEAGVALRAGYASLAAPTAKARTTAAALGLDIDKFRSIDYSKIEVDNFVNGVAARIGREMAEKARARAAKAIDTFKTDGDAAKLNDSLTSAIQKTGAKTLQDHVRAANLERDVVSPLVSKIDLPGLIAALNKLDASIGAFNGIFGAKMGGKLSVLDGARLQRDAKTLDDAENSDNYKRSIEEYQKSYTGKTDRAKGTLTGLEDKIFQTNKPILEKATEHATGFLEWLETHPTATTVGADTGAAIGAGGAAWMSWKTAQAILKIARPAGQAAAEAAPEIVLPEAGAAAGGAVAGEAATAGEGFLAGAAAVGLPLLAAGGATYLMRHLASRMPTAEEASRYHPENELPGLNDGGDEAVPAYVPPAWKRPAEQPYQPKWLDTLDHRDDKLENFREAVEMARVREAAKPIALPEIAHPLPVITPPAPSAAPVDVGSRLTAALAELKTIGTKETGPTHVEGVVTGQATLSQTLHIEPSPLFMATMNSAKAGVNIALNGKLGKTMRDSNAAITPVSPGLSSFKATTSGR